jgi:di/tricarboxylate transporter
VRTLRSGSVRIGIAGGVLFFLNGLIDGSRSYPFIWPTLAGAVAFWVATRAAQQHRLRQGFLAALIAGVVTGLIGFMGASLTVLVAGRSDFSSVQANAGLRARVLIALAAELGIGAACLVAVVAAVAGGVLMTPVRWLRPPGSAAPAA